jgi:hypothetical protein
MDLTPFNPLARENLGASVAEAMLERKADPLSTVVAKSFKGAGIYALYPSWSSSIRPTCRGRGRWTGYLAIGRHRLPKGRDPVIMPCALFVEQLIYQERKLGIYYVQIGRPVSYVL